ncbi:MAG: hypothetical protein ABIF71_02850 [Planctomycetota bacterium]
MQSEFPTEEALRFLTLKDELCRAALRRIFLWQAIDDARLEAQRCGLPVRPLETETQINTLPPARR